MLCAQVVPYPHATASIVSSHQTIPTVYAESFALEWPAQTKQKHWFQFIYTSGIFRGAHTTQRVHYQGEKISKHFNRAQKCSVVVKEETVGFPNDSEFGAYYLRGLKNWLGRCNLRHIQAYPFTASTMTSFNV